MKRTAAAMNPLAFLLAIPLLLCTFPSPSRAQETPAERKSAEAPAKEAQRLRDLGDLYAEQDKHGEAIDAYRSAIAADPALTPTLRLSLGKQLLWADRPREAIPLLSSAVAERPDDAEAKRHLALAYRHADRLKEAEGLYREVLAVNPADSDARGGLALTLLWEGRFRAATPEFERVLADRPADADALVGLSRARLYLDLPEEAASYNDRALASSPRNPEALEQAERIRERLARHLDVAVRGSEDSDDLTLIESTLSAHGHPRPRWDIDGAVRQLFFRQGSPGKTVNIGQEDSADGTGGSLSASYRASNALGWRAGVGHTRYNVGNFHPWSGNLGVSLTPGDTVRFSLEWERSHFDSILSLQNQVTADAFSFSASKHFLWKTEITGTAALLFHHNENTTGQDRENRGERFTLELSRLLYLRGDDIRVTGLARLGWLGFSHDLDVGVFDPRRYTTEEVGLDWQWRFRPLWEFHGTLTGGAQQEKGHSGGPLYTADLALDRKVGRGLISLAGFSSDSNARGRGRGEGYRRHGGQLSVSIPF